LISPTATSEAFTEIDDAFIRVVSDTNYYAEMAAKLLKKRYSRVGIIYDQRNKAYTHNWRDSFGKYFDDA